MDHAALGIGAVHRLGELEHEAQRTLLGHLSAIGRQPGLEIGADHPFHEQVIPAEVTALAGKEGEAGVVDRGQGRGLAVEPADGSRPLHVLLREDLHRQILAGEVVVHGVHFAHRAGTKGADDGVVAIEHLPVQHAGRLCRGRFERRDGRSFRGGRLGSGGSRAFEGLDPTGGRLAAVDLAGLLQLGPE